MRTILLRIISLSAPLAILSSFPLVQAYYSGNDAYYCNPSNNYCRGNGYPYNSVDYCPSNSNYPITGYCPSPFPLGNSVTYYCLPGTSYCSTVPYTARNNNYYCNAWNDYCRYGNHDNGYGPYDRVSIPYRDESRYCTAANDYCNDDYTRNRTDGRSSSSLFQPTRNPQSDLIVESISAIDANRTVVTRVCNIGGNMTYPNNWIIEISNSTTGSKIRSYMNRISAGQCTDITADYRSLGVYRSGAYSISAIIDPDNSMNEQSRYANSRMEYLQMAGY